MSELDYLHESLTKEEERAEAFLFSWGQELIKTIVPAVAIVLTVNLFFAQPRTVHGQSMEPNLYEDQRVIIELVSLHFRMPRRGEIVVLNLPDRHDDPLIKRVVGLPGDRVEIHEGAVYVNDVRLSEPYLNQRTPGNGASQIVPEGHVFVLGDNRRCSNDSRYFGTVPVENLLGRAWLRYWPPTDVGLFE
jgi:signal peptidase I